MWNKSEENLTEISIDTKVVIDNDDDNDGGDVCMEVTEELLN